MVTAGLGQLRPPPGSSRTGSPSRPAASLRPARRGSRGRRGGRAARARPGAGRQPAHRVPWSWAAQRSNLVLEADGLVVVTPVFNASYSGLFKMFFDVVEQGSLSGMPVLMAATGGTAPPRSPSSTRCARCSPTCTPSRCRPRCSRRPTTGGRARRARRPRRAHRPGRLGRSRPASSRRPPAARTERVDPFETPTSFGGPASPAAERSRGSVRSRCRSGVVGTAPAADPSGHRCRPASWAGRAHLSAAAPDICGVGGYRVPPRRAWQRNGDRCRKPVDRAPVPVERRR